METRAILTLKKRRGKAVSTIACRTANIGAGGAFFRTPSPLESNTRVAVELALGAGRKGKRLCEEERRGSGFMVNGTVLRSGSEGTAVGFDGLYQIVPLHAEETQSSISCQTIGEQRNVAQTSHSRKGGEERHQTLGKSEVDNQTNLSYGGVKMKKVMQFLRDEEGATGVEYGIMVAAIAAVIVAVVFAIGVKVDNAFDTVNDALN